MNLKTILLLLLTLTFNDVFSQNDRVLTGKLLDSLTSEPLAFASVWANAISQTPLTKGIVADEKGSFEIVGLRKDKYIIKVEYVGYKTKFIEVDASKEIQRLDLGAITLSPLSQLLESITVSGLNPDVVATIEKQVYKAEQFEVSTDGTATDVLKNIPSVAVNAEGEITVRGSKGFMVMVNGKPSQVDVATLLAQIPANSIDKIEMITAPLANFLYDLGKDLRVKLAYSRRVQRSTNNELNPYPEREHSETLEQRDPNIRPEFIGIYEAGITKDLKKTSFYLNVYSQLITDIVNPVNNVRNDTILNRIYTNAGNARLIGTELGSTYSPVKQLKIFMGGNIYNLKIKGILFDKSVAVDSRGWVYSINSNINYQILPSFSIPLNVA